MDVRNDNSRPVAKRTISPGSSIDSRSDISDQADHGLQAGTITKRLEERESSRHRSILAMPMSSITSNLCETPSRSHGPARRPHPLSRATSGRSSSRARSHRSSLPGLQPPLVRSTAPTYSSTSLGPDRRRSASPPHKRQRLPSTEAGAKPAVQLAGEAGTRSVSASDFRSRLPKSSQRGLLPFSNIESAADLTKSLRMNFTVEGRYMWDEPETGKLTLLVNPEAVKEYLSCSNCESDRIPPAIEAKLIERQGQEIRSEPSEKDTQVALFASVSLISELKAEITKLEGDVISLQEHAELMKVKRKTPEAIFQAGNSGMVQSLERRVRQLEAENAILKSNQLNLSQSFSEAQSEQQETSDTGRPDSYLELSPAPQPNRQHKARMTLMLDECRKQEQVKHQQALSRARARIVTAHQHIDALIEEQWKERAIFRSQLDSLFKEKEAALARIRETEDEKQERRRSIQQAAREYTYLQNKYDALDGEYLKIKKQRDMALNIGLQANKNLEALLKKQTESQLAVQQLFELNKINQIREEHAEEPEAQGEIPSQSIHSDDTMANLRRGNRETSGRDSKHAHLSTGTRKEPPGPLRLSQRPSHLPQIDRSNGDAELDSDAETAINSSSFSIDLHTGTTDNKSARDSRASSDVFGPPGLTPLFQSDSFQSWRYSSVERARVLLDITTMDEDRREYTFRRGDLIFVYPTKDDFWPAQIFHDEFEEIYALPVSAFELVCDHEHSYKEVFKIEAPWTAPNSEDFVNLPNPKGNQIARWAHSVYFGQDAEPYGCIKLEDGSRGLAPMRHLTAISRVKRGVASCPCEPAGVYFADGLILKDCISRPEGIHFRLGDAVEVAHTTSKGEYCIRKKRDGANGFVPAANLRIHEAAFDLEIGTDRPYGAGNGLAALDLIPVMVDTPSAMEFEKTKQETWNDDDFGDNPHRRRWSELDRRLGDKKYRDWMKGPPLGDQFVEVKDYKKLPQIWKDVLTVNPVGSRKNLNRPRSKSSILPSRMHKYHIRRGPNVGLQSKVTIADGEVITEEQDRGYLSEPVTEEKRTRRRHFVFEQDVGTPSNLDEYVLKDDPLAVERIDSRFLFPGQILGFTNLLHRRPGFLTEEGLRILEALLEKKQFRDTDVDTINKLLEWSRYGLPLVYKLKDNTSIEGKSWYKDSDVFEIVNMLPVPAPECSALIVGHRDRQGFYKNPNARILRADQLAHENPLILTCTLVDSDAGKPYSKAILLYIELKEGVSAWVGIMMGDGKNIPISMGSFPPTDMRSFKYVPLKDVFDVIQKAQILYEENKNWNEPLPKNNATILELYDRNSEEYRPDTPEPKRELPPSPLTAYANKIRDGSLESCVLREEYARLEENNASLAKEISRLKQEVEKLRIPAEVHDEEQEDRSSPAKDESPRISISESTPNDAELESQGEIEKASTWSGSSTDSAIGSTSSSIRQTHDRPRSISGGIVIEKENSSIEDEPLGSPQTSTNSTVLSDIFSARDSGSTRTSVNSNGSIQPFSAQTSSLGAWTARNSSVSTLAIGSPQQNQQDQYDQHNRVSQIYELFSQSPSPPHDDVDEAQIQDVEQRQFVQPYLANGDKGKNITISCTLNVVTGPPLQLVVKTKRHCQKLACENEQLRHYVSIFYSWYTECAMRVVAQYVLLYAALESDRLQRNVELSEYLLDVQAVYFNEESPVSEISNPATPVIEIVPIEYQEPDLSSSVVELGPSHGRNDVLIDVLLSNLPPAEWERYLKKIGDWDAGVPGPSIWDDDGSTSTSLSEEEDNSSDDDFFDAEQPRIVEL